MNKEFLFLGVAITGLTALGICSILLLTLVKPGQDNSRVVFQVVTILTPSLVALIGALKAIQAKNESVQAKNDVCELKSSVDSNSDHIEKQIVKVDALAQQVADTKSMANIAMSTVNSLKDK